MKRTLIALILLLHGLAHAGVGMWAAELGPASLITPLWIAALGGYVAAGFGVLGLRPFAARWQALAGTATAASVLLLIPFGELVPIAGLLVDLTILTVVLRARVAPLPPRGAHGALRRIGEGAALAFTAYAAIVIAVRPWALRMGSTAEERSLRLPGDETVPVARYRMDHAITIAAPPSAVWPWLVQIGQDRAGFYSHERLERLFGARIHNVNRIVPAWQQRAPGDLVRAVQPEYLGGRFGSEIGWRVASVVPNESLVLHGWGAFVIRPLGADSSRLIIRTRGAGTPSFLGTLAAPAGLLLFEPAHFIMQRAMMRGIKARAEGNVRSGERVASGR